ncbi:methyltransferase family protein [Desulfosediminicola flagellatus]|uniref:methyltransferase family protein n=1 Tax=Desulfosediminicola flagellatus TaxID=2569541 RepID=UPI0010AC969C|nr:NnrU family protein [Desulfosediminicola flagellatus]
MDFISYTLLTTGWIAWCGLHSLLISKSISGYLHGMLGTYRYYYRLLYNLIALFSLIPLLLITDSMRFAPVFTWQGGWNFLRAMMFGLSIWLFIDGARNYDFSCMLGFRQIKSRQQIILLGDDEQFCRKGSHGIIRHPWYLGGLLIIWSRYQTYYDSTMVVAIVLSVYLIVGSWLEERKLVAEYGEKYRCYQQDVSMLFPWKWLVKKFSRER